MKRTTQTTAAQAIASMNKTLDKFELERPTLERANKVSAELKWNKYQAYLSVGFSVEQAFELLKGE